MLGISDGHIITQGHEADGLSRELDGVRLYYNSTAPTTIRDGVDSVTVVDEGDGYQILLKGDLGGYYM